MCQYIGLPAQPEHEDEDGERTRLMCPCCAEEGNENNLWNISSSEIYFCPVCDEYFNDKDEIIDVAINALLERRLEK